MILKPIFLSTLLWLTLSMANGQRHNNKNNLGIFIQTRSLLNKNKEISINGGYSAGLFYTFNHFEKAGIPFYFSIGTDYYTYFGQMITKSYIEAEPAYRRYFKHSKGPAFYIEGGVQGRWLLNERSINPPGRKAFYLNQYCIIPKISVGLESDKYRFFYLNLEYSHSLNSIFKYDDKRLNHYIGFRFSAVFRQFN